MISKFGICIRNIREQKNDSLRQMAIKLGISAAFLSAMEVGRKQIPLEYLEKIKGIYNLSEEQEIELENSIYETNERVPLELSLMNDAQKDVSLMFARKIKTADEELLKKLKEALLDEED
ncbi:MAG: helix-turn-helix domain-containing protein [Anaeroplasmataceae bacterium]